MGKPTFEELNNRLAPTITDLKEIQNSFKNKVIRQSLISWGIILLITLIFAGTLESYIPIILGIIIAIIATFTINSIKTSDLCKIYKKQIITPLVEALVENGKYEPEKGISENLFRSSGLFPTPDRYHSEDLISGTEGKTALLFSEVHAEEKHTSTDSKGRTRTTWTTLFRGFIFVADFHKNFSGHTIVKRNSILKFGGNRVKMESPEFEKNFDVFSSDEIEARYLITPSMMERIIDLDAKFNRSVQMSFINSFVIITINESQNHFETKLWTSIGEDNTLRREYATISALISIVEDLNLNTRIWTKE